MKSTVTPDMPNYLMTSPEFANYMGWTVKNVQCRVSNGSDMPKSIRIGTRRLWRKGDVDAWLKAHEEETSIIAVAA